MISSTTLLTVVTLLAGAVLPGFDPPQEGPELVQQVAFPDYGFDLHIPPSWERIPSELVTELSAQATRWSSGSDSIKYVAGFQVGPTQYWGEYPYVLVQVMEIGPVPEEAFRDYMTENPGSTSLEEMEKRVEDESDVASVEAGEPIWDPDDRLIWMRVDGQNDSGERFQGLSAMKVYGRGVLALHYYYRRDGDPPSVSDMESVLGNISYAPGFEYDRERARAAQESDLWSSVIERGLSGGMAGALLGLVVGLIGWAASKLFR